MSQTLKQLFLPLLLALCLLLSGCGNAPALTFQSNGGSAVATISGKAGDPVTEPTAPTKTGYTFSGWYRDETFNHPYTFTALPAEPCTLYAKWEERTTTLTFKTIGGSAISPLTLKPGMPISAPTPMKTDQTFVGWYSDAQLTTPFIFDKMPEEDTSVYARWQPNSIFYYRVTGQSATITSLKCTFTGEEVYIPPTLGGCPAKR
jgi:uncharacterized repeat protein (TIGR02543 family)